MVSKTSEVLRDLPFDKLKQYIFYLTQRYYSTYLADDIEAHNTITEQLYVIMEEYNAKYCNLDGFVCFCLYLNGNVELMRATEDKAFMLEPLFPMELKEEDVEELPFDIKNIFNKERIRERYNEKRTCQVTE